MTHEDRTISLLVGVAKSGVISTVKTKGADGVNEEFLAQFRGKTWQDSFEIARAQQDLLYIPAKIKALQENVALSERIAQGVKEVAWSAAKVIK